MADENVKKPEEETLESLEVAGDAVAEEAAPAKAKTPAKPAAKPLKKAAPAAAAAAPAGKPAKTAEKPVKQAAAKPAEPEDDAEQQEEEDESFSKTLMLMLPSWLASMVVHMVGFLVLALWFNDGAAAQNRIEVVTAISEEEELDQLDEPMDEPLLDPMDVTVTEITNEAPVDSEMDISPATDLDAAAVAVDLTDFGLEKAPRSDLMATVGAYSGSGVEGRGSGKAGLVARGGGNERSERAVALALKWLAEHQMPDGGWSIDLTAVPNCRGQCRHSGKSDKARLAATGLALLPFLGAGHTQKTGKYQQTVQRGLYFIVSNMKLSPQGGSMHENQGNMYSHGICSIALCEAYAMTQDRALQNPAQAAINFIAYAQDPVGGGWRYQIRQPGDTSVVGWQIMALKSGHMAYLRVPPVTVKKAFDFLDSVQSNSGANYGYTGPGQGPATTAIGLLCRMYLGWKKDNPALQRGVKWLSDRGPSKNDFYYNYYATQVLRHWEGEEWVKWNNVMRDQLVNTQAQKGHETGSWYEEGGHANESGGRLYCTAMATMILEVYYRHLPIYRSQSVDENFPL